MRPKSVKLGERLYALSLILAVVLATIGWANSVAVMGPVLALGVTALYVGAAALLLLLAARRGSRVSLWLLTALTVVNVLGFLLQVQGGVVAAGRSAS